MGSSIQALESAQGCVSSPVLCVYCCMYQYHLAPPGSFQLISSNKTCEFEHQHWSFGNVGQFCSDDDQKRPKPTPETSEIARFYPHFDLRSFPSPNLEFLQVNPGPHQTWVMDSICFRKLKLHRQRDNTLRLSSLNVGELCPGSKVDEDERLPTHTLQLTAESQRAFH